MLKIKILEKLDRKFLVLNICLYLIILIVSLVSIYKIITVYRIINLSIFDNLPKQICIDRQKVNIDFKGVKIYFQLNDVFINDNKYSKISINEINGTINILSSILLGRVKVSNLILKDVDVTVNSSYTRKKIAEINASVIFNFDFNSIAEKVVRLSANFPLDNINWRLDSSFCIKNKNFSLINLKLNNVASNLRDIFYYLPEVFVNKKLLNWLDDCLLSGSIIKSELLVDKKNNFNLMIKFKDVDFRYSKSWPIIQKLSATMNIVDNNLSVYMDSGDNKGYVINQPFSALSAELKDINEDLLKPLSVKGEIKKLKFSLLLDGKILLINNDLFNAKILMEDEANDFFIEKLKIFDKEFNNIKIANEIKNNSWYFNDQSSQGYITILTDKIKVLYQDLNVNIEAKCDITRNNQTHNNNQSQTSHPLVTHISGKISGKNFGQLLETLNIDKKVIQGGEGSIKIDLKVQGDFFQVLDNSTGTFDLDLKSGAIVGVDPGLGRIIGLFNLENIPRRLQLDFSDLTGKGFIFDYFKGQLSVNNGQLLCNEVFINGPSANLTIKGSTSLISKQLDLLIDAKSKVSATLPLAAAIASGNPVIGAALWLFDHASGAGDQVGEIRIQKYKILGTWDKPEISQL